MYGAILGDIVGSPYEFDKGEKTKDFPLFLLESRFTDDTVMSIATAEALMAGDLALTDHEWMELFTEHMKKWGLRHEDAGYGRKFWGWFHMEKPEPMGSFGNGSAMRVSPVGWMFDSIFMTRHMAVLSAAVSHDHPEGIKGAEAVASAIFLARQGADKEIIRNYIVQEFGYNLNRTLDQIRPTYKHVATCQGSVPEAIIAFLESSSTEDAVRLAVSLGGDTDTLACMAGSIAEAYYGMPEELIQECRSRVTPEMLEVLDLFDRKIGR